ncbi:MAG: hypothetical protein JJE01_06770 [Gemmatimonadetes bacterium]|nr:hypothetical protein [Gemmatimonadota bacterium]
MNSRAPRIDTGLLRLVRSHSDATEAAIGRALETSEPFRSLCSDLRACSRALTHWRKTDSDEARRRVDEYTDLLAELTSEIRLMLAEQECAGRRSED